MEELEFSFVQEIPAVSIAITLDRKDTRVDPGLSKDQGDGVTRYLLLGEPDRFSVLRVGRIDLAGREAVGVKK